MAERLKVMVVDLYGTGAPQYAMIDCVDAFRRCGHEVNVVNPKEDYIDREIIKFSPDLFFTINHLYLIPDVKRLLHERDIPSVSWFFDLPHFKEVSQYDLELCIIFLGDRVWSKGLKDLGFKNVFYLPFGTNPEIFKKLDLTREERELYSCNISFAGSSIYQAYNNLCKNNENRDPEIHSLLKKAVRLQSENPYIYTSDIVNEIAGLAPLPLFKDADERRLLESEIELAAASLHRKNTIEEISKFGLSLYGDDGWRSLLNGDKYVRFKGGINNRSELPKLYNASRINLNITRPQAKTALNMRVFDILACGAFLISDYRRDMAELFELGKDVVCYHSRDELSELVRYFLDHPEERREIARRGRERVLKEHKYEDRINVVVDTFHQIFG